jgi:SAM-dependent methyltransferase
MAAFVVKAFDDCRYRRQMIEAWARHDIDTYRAFTATVAATSKPVEGARVLDIGCGLNAPMTLMLHAAGVSVTGIDRTIGHLWGLGLRPGRYVRYIREAGAVRAARKLVGELVYDRHYFRVLQDCLSLPLTDRGVDLRVMRAEALEFPDETFDLVHSNATWEHLPDPLAVNREVARVLRPGGLAFIEIHLFPSLSGGHDLPWIVPGKTDARGVQPWSHLRNPAWKPPVYLNRLRERDFLRMFKALELLDIVEWKTEFREGAELLTEDLLRELHPYDADELTKRSIVVVLRRRDASRPCASRNDSKVLRRDGSL